MAGVIRLAVAPIAWSNSDLPELGGDTPLEVCLRESRAAGFTGTETGIKYPLDPAVLGPLLERYDLKLASGWFSGRLLEGSVSDERVRMAEQMACFRALGAPVMVYAETTGSLQSDRGAPVSQRPRMDPAHFPAYGRKLTELAEHMRDDGVPMAYHPHMGTVIETDEDIDRLMETTGPAVGLLVDTGHAVYAGADPCALVRRHAERLNHIHCKDIRPDILQQVRADDTSFLAAVLAGVFTVPGDGQIDYDRFAAELAAADYTGWVVVEAEQDPATAPPLTYARIGHAALTAAFSAAGFKIAD